MKTTFDAIDIIYSVINNSSLKTGVNGTINKLKRQTGSTKEDIVINSIALTDTNLQEGVFNVNIYVPNITINSSSLPNTVRLKALSEEAKELFEEVSGSTYNIWLSEQFIFEDVQTSFHYINLRLRFRFLGN